MLQLASMTALVDLNISGCVSVRDGDLALFGQRLLRLRSFSCSYCERVTSGCGLSVCSSCVLFHESSLAVLHAAVVWNQHSALQIHELNAIVAENSVYCTTSRSARR